MKKLILSALTLAVSHVCFAVVDLGQPSGGTPYDRYMNPVKDVLTQIDGSESSMNRVRKLMHTGRAFRYSFTDPYTAATPDYTARVRAGDCKAKALWLADQINDSSVRFVIGKAKRTSRISHAWLMWEHNNRWWILDCTNMREPIAADRVSSSSYIPLYSYAKNGAYRHGSTRMMTAESVATRAPVASNRR